MPISMLRKCEPADTTLVAEFLSAHLAARTVDAWRSALTRILWNNPNAATSQSSGWVLEHRSDGVVGFLGNVVHPFQVTGREIRAAATTAWCVAPAHRSLGLLLVEAFIEQDDIDLLFNTTANQVASQLFERLGFQRAPTPWFSTVAYWVTQPSRFARGAAVHFTGSHVLGTIAGLTAALPLAVLERFSGRVQAAEAGEIQVEILNAFGEEWPKCWSAWRDGLTTGVRTSPQLEWRLLASDVRCLCARSSDGEPLGYVACRKELDHGGSLARLRVIDLWVQPDRSDVIRRLVQTAQALAADLDCGSLEIFGMSQAVRDAIAPLRPRLRSMSSWPYYIRAKDKALESALSDVARWHPTGYDGDTAFAAGSSA
jgi:hypothetical protein